MYSQVGPREKLPCQYNAEYNAECLDEVFPFFHFFFLTAAEVGLKSMVGVQLYYYKF